MRRGTALSSGPVSNKDFLIPHTTSSVTCRPNQAAAPHGKRWPSQKKLASAGSFTIILSGLVRKDAVWVAAGQASDVNPAGSSEPQVAATKPKYRRRAKIQKAANAGPERLGQANAVTEARRHRSHHVVTQQKSVDDSRNSDEESDGAPLPIARASPVPLPNKRRTRITNPAGANLVDGSSSSNDDNYNDGHNSTSSNKKSILARSPSTNSSSNRSSSPSSSPPELTGVKRTTRRPTATRRRRRAAAVSTAPVGLIDDMQLSQQATSTEGGATTNATTSVAPPPPVPVLEVASDTDISLFAPPFKQGEDGFSEGCDAAVTAEEAAAVANTVAMLLSSAPSPAEAPPEGMETTTTELGISAGAVAAAAAAAAEQQASDVRVTATRVAVASEAAGAQSSALEVPSLEVACGVASEQAHGDVVVTGAADNYELISELEAGEAVADPRVRTGAATTTSAPAELQPHNAKLESGRPEELNPIAQGAQGRPQAINATSDSEAMDAAAGRTNGDEPAVLSLAAGGDSPGITADAGSSAGDGATAEVSQSGATPAKEEELDDTAVAISVLAAAAASGAAAAVAGQHPFPYAPRGGTRRRTSTWELRPPARRPPRVVPFTDVGGVRELQALINAVSEPTIIDLQGAVLTLAAAAEPSQSPPPSTERAELQTELPPAAAPTPVATTALVPFSIASKIPGWSSVAELVVERAKMLATEPSKLATGAADGSASAPQPPDGVLLLHRDDVTLTNGTLQLQKDCRLVVTGRRVTLRRVEVVDVEAAGWGRQATALPATCLQPSALITVISPNSSSLYGIGPSAMYGSGDAGGPSLELDDCSVIASGRDRDLARVDGAGGGATLTARFSRLRGGANAAVAAENSTLYLDCCELEGYTASGVVALGASVRLVGSRLLGLAGSIVGLQAVAGSQVSVLGCFLRGHSSNVECMGGSSVDMQGCVLSRSDCRYGLTLHAASAGAASGPHHTHTPPAIPAAGSSSSSGGGGSGGGGSSVSSSSPSSSPSLPSPSSAAANSASSHTGRMRLTDCELSHAIQLGGGEVELERCTFALRPTPADRAMPPVQNMSGPALGSNLLAIMAAMKNAVALSQGVLSSASGAGDAGAAFAGRVAATASLRVAGCRVGGGNGGSGEGQVVMEAAQEARVFVSGSPGVLIRRCGGASGVP